MVGKMPDVATKTVSEVATYPSVGILTGISYASGLDYYQGINRQVTELLPRGKYSANFPEISMVSLNCGKYVELLAEEDLTGAEDYIFSGIQKLHRTGVDFLAIASNTSHVVADRVKRELPDVPLLHIADCSAAAARRLGAKRVGILGTEPTMAHPRSWLKKRLSEHGLETLVPHEKYHHRIYSIIKDELSHEILKDESREFLLEMVKELANDGADSVLLGCTELELLVKSVQTSIPLIRSAECHITAIAEVQAGVTKLSDYLPKN